MKSQIKKKSKESTGKRKGVSVHPGPQFGTSAAAKAKKMIVKQNACDGLTWTEYSDGSVFVSVDGVVLKELEQVGRHFDMSGEEFFRKTLRDGAWFRLYALKFVNSRKAVAS